MGGRWVEPPDEEPARAAACRPPRRAGGDGGGGRAAAGDRLHRVAGGRGDVLPGGRLCAHRRRPRPPDREPAGELHVPGQQGQHEAGERPARAQHGEQQPGDGRGRPGPQHGEPPRRAVPDLGPVARPQDVGPVRHAAQRGHRGRLPDGPGRPHRAERGQPVAAGQDPGVRLPGQRLDQRRPGHRGRRPAGLPGRARGADRQRGHRRLQQQPAVRRQLPHRGATASSSSTTSDRPRTSSTCTRRTGRATATRTAAGTRRPRSTAACS